MTDHEDLIRRLEDPSERCLLHFDSARAIKELVADYKGQGEALIKEVNAKLEAQIRAEKAEADLAAARAAIQWAWGMRDDLTKEAHVAIAAARDEGGE